jgi:hypothetical protein
MATPTSSFARMRGLDGEEAKTAGVEIAVDVIQGVRALTSVSGVTSWLPGGRPRPSRGGQGGRARRDGRRPTPRLRGLGVGDLGLRVGLALCFGRHAELRPQEGHGKGDGANHEARADGEREVVAAG